MVTFTILGQVAQARSRTPSCHRHPAGRPDVRRRIGDLEPGCRPRSRFRPTAGRSTWTYASLASGDPAVTITYDVTIDADASGDLVNVAELCVSELPDCVSADATVTPIAGELGIQKSNDAPLVATDLGDGTTVDLPTAAEGATVTYTLDYTVKEVVHNGVVTDVLPAGVTYVDGSASSDAQFTFVNYNPSTRTLTWKAAEVSENGSLTYKVTIDAGAAELAQPLVNTATIDSDETEPASDDLPGLRRAGPARPDAPADRRARAVGPREQPGLRPDAHPPLRRCLRPGDRVRHPGPGARPAAGPPRLSRSG